MTTFSVISEDNLTSDTSKIIGAALVECIQLIQYIANEAWDSIYLETGIATFCVTSLFGGKPALHGRTKNHPG